MRGVGGTGVAILTEPNMGGERSRKKRKGYPALNERRKKFQRLLEGSPVRGKMKVPRNVNWKTTVANSQVGGGSTLDHFFIPQNRNRFPWGNEETRPFVLGGQV